MRRRSANARASGVDREPGQTRHRMTPSARPLIDQGGAEGGLYAHPACHSMPKYGARGHRSVAAARVHPDRPALGSLRRPSGRIAHPRRPGPARPRRLRLGAGRSAATAAAWWPRRSGPPWARNPATCSATRWVPGWPFMWPNGDGPVPAPRGASSAAPAASRMPKHAPRGAGRTRPTADRLETAGDVEGFLEALAARPDVRPAARSGGRPRRTPPQQRVGTGIEPAAVRDRHPRSAVGSPLDARAALSWPWPEPTTIRFAAHAPQDRPPCAEGRGLAGARWRSCRAPGSQPEQTWPAGAVTGSIR